MPDTCLSHPSCNPASLCAPQPQELLPVGTFNWGALPGKRRLGPVATRKELLQLHGDEGVVPATTGTGAANGVAREAHELSV